MIRIAFTPGDRVSVLKGVKTGSLGTVKTGPSKTNAYTVLVDGESHTRPYQAASLKTAPDSPVGASLPPLPALVFGGVPLTNRDGVLYLGASKLGYTANVVKAEIVAGNIVRQTNAAGGQWDWKNNTWQPWKAPSPTPPPAPSGERLLGTAIVKAPVAGSAEEKLLLDSYDSFTLRYFGKWKQMNESTAEYLRFVDWCILHGKARREHCDYWWTDLPPLPTDAAGIKAKMEERAKQLGSLAKPGRRERDVFNEVFADKGGWRDWPLLRAFNGDGMAMLRYGLDLARTYDATVDRVLNDYGIVEYSDPAKSKLFCDTAITLAHEGRLECVGIQGHPRYPWNVTAAQLAAFEAPLRAAGLKIRYTELGGGNDSGVDPLVKLMLTSSAEWQTWWGPSDAETDVGGGSQLFDTSHKPKPAYSLYAPWRDKTPTPTPTPDPDPTPAPSGVPIIGLELGGDGSIFTKLKKDGIGWYRTNSSGYSKIPQARAAGMDVATVVFGEPATMGKIIGAIDPVKFGQQARAFVDQYKLPRLQVLNEPWGDWFWSDAGNVTHYVKLLKATFEALKGSGCKVSCAWTPGFGDQVFAAGGGAYCDEIEIHPYGGTNHDAASAAGDRKMVLDAHAKTGKPVVIGEQGWPTQSATGDSAKWSEAEQVTNIVEFCKWVLTVPNVVSVVCLYGSRGNYGILRDDGSEKPSYKAFAQYATD